MVPLPGSEAGRSASALGGWQLAVSKYSKHPAEAAKFIMWFGSAEVQKQRALGQSLLPTKQSLYQDPQVVKIWPFAPNLLSAFNSAVARPSTATAPHYNEVSTIFYQKVSDVLTGKSNGTDAVANISLDLQDLLGSSTGAPPAAEVLATLMPMATATSLPTAVQSATEESTPTAAAPGEAIKATAGQAVKMVLLPKFLGISVFDQVNNGALIAAKELDNPEELQYRGPTPENSVAGQIEIVNNAVAQGVKAIMISNNAGDQIAPAVKAARDAGTTVTTWDSPIPTGEGEQLFIAQVDFAETGKVMADMALDILGADGGQFAILSASPDAANQNAWIASMEEALKDPKYAKLEVVDTVYGNDQAEDSYYQALTLVDKYPDMKLIMAPTSVGIVAAAKAMQDQGLCETVKVSGLGLPAEMLEYTKNGCAPEFALWSFETLGYLSYYATYLIATDALQPIEGASFDAGRMGTYTIEKDPTRENGLRVVMGPFLIYNKSNISLDPLEMLNNAASAPDDEQPVASATVTPKPTATATTQPTFTPTATPKVAPTVLPAGEVQAAGLNVRSGPGTNFSILGTVTAGDKLQIVGRYDDNCRWLQVITPTGIKGWAAGTADYVTLDRPCAEIPLGAPSPAN